MLSTSSLTYFSAILALIFWAFLPILSLHTDDVPPFLKVGIATLFSSAGYLIYWLIKYKGNIVPRLSIPITYTLLCVIGVLGNNVTFVYSMKLGGGAAPYIIMNAWPICALMLSSIIFKDKLTIIDYIGSALGMSGVLLLALHDETESNQDDIAILIAILNCIIWSTFSVLNKRFTKMPFDAMGMPLFVIGIICIGLHLLFEEAVTLTQENIYFLIALGLGPWGIAFSLWNFAVRHTANLSTLTHFGFLAPALGLAMMIFLGYTEFSIMLFPAFLCIIGGCILTTAGKKR